MDKRTEEIRERLEAPPTEIEIAELMTAMRDAGITAAGIDILRRLILQKEYLLERIDLLQGALERFKDLTNPEYQPDGDRGVLRFTLNLGSPEIEGGTATDWCFVDLDDDPLVAWLKERETRGEE